MGISDLPTPRFGKNNSDTVSISREEAVFVTVKTLASWKILRTTLKDSRNPIRVPSRIYLAMFINLFLSILHVGR